MSETIQINESDFDAVVLKESRPVLVDFWSPTCGPCRLLAPIVDALAKTNDDKLVVAKCNVFENATLAAKLDVAVLPTIILFKNGEVVARLSGVQKQSTLQELVDANL